MNSAALLERMNFGLALANNKSTEPLSILRKLTEPAIHRQARQRSLPGATEVGADAAGWRCFGANASDDRRARRQRVAERRNVIAGLLLGSPEFQTEMSGQAPSKWLTQSG